MTEKIKILVVDDEESACKTLGGILEDEGYAVDTAKDGDKAIEMVKTAHYRIIFMDIKMPGINGVEAFKEIKRIDEDTAVVMMTAFSVEELIKEALEEGAFACVYKPFDMEKILKTIEEVLKAGLILIVDDRATDRQTLKAILEDRGYRVATAKGGEEAIKMVKEKGFDICFVDIKMPFMDGVETLKRIKEIKPDMPVIMMTGYSVEELVKKALEHDAYTCIYKPFDINKVLQIITEVRSKR